MADEKRQLVLDLLARAKTKQGTDQAADDLDKFGDAAEKADKKAEGLGKTSEKTSRQTDKLGHNLENTKGRVSGLDKEIEGINRELAALSASFADANTASERLDISKSIRRTEGDLKRVTKNRSVLSALLPDPEPEVASWTKRMGSSLAESTRGLASSSLLGTAGAVIGTTLAPMIGGLIAGAVVGGVGIGGIVGGIALAAKADTTIQTYAGNIGKSFKERIQDEAKESFSGPIMESLGKLEVAAAKGAGGIGKIFRNLAPSVGPLVDNLIHAGEAIGGSLVNAAGKAGPVLNSLGKFINYTADSLGNFIDMAADHADEGASSIDDLNNALQNTIKVATGVVDALATIKGGLDSLDSNIDKARYSLEDNVSWLDLTADGYKKGSEAAELYRKGIIGVAGSANDYDHYVNNAIKSTDTLRDSHEEAKAAADKQKKAEQELTNELKSQTDPAFALLNAMDGVRDAQKGAAEATKKYGDNSKEAHEASRKLAEAAINLQGAAGQAGGTLNGTLSPALRATLKAAGLTASEIDDVEAQLRAAKRAADGYAKTYRAKVITEYIDKYSSIVTDSANSAYEKTKKEIAGKRAAGGPVVRGAPYLVGENGPEIMVPDASGRVLNSSASRGLVVQAGMKGTQGTMAAAGGGGGTRAVVEVTGAADQGVATLINFLIRSGKVNVTVTN